MEIGEVLGRAQRRLLTVSDSAASDARVLLADTLGATTAWVLAHDQELVSHEQATAFEDRVARCAAGEPLPYVLGWWEFYGRRFAVGPQVLIPRPETELLVDAALRELRTRTSAARIIDVGTGSGCIGITLAAELPACRVFATDLSRDALRVARANAQNTRVAGRVRLVQADLLIGLGGTWDLVCANLPYLAWTTNRVSQRNPVCLEPQLALDGGARGTEIARRLIAGLGRHLAPGGLALLEIDEGQAQELSGQAGLALAGTTEIALDLAGRERLLAIRRTHAG
jgi:release factor glutamine methyltransferase